MIIPTTSYENIANKYSDAVTWMKSLDIQINKNRVVHYQKIIECWASSYKKASLEDGRRIYPDFLSSIFEVHDFIDIYYAFKDVPNNQLIKIIEKLQKSVNGPLNAVEEKPETTAARNFLFEALVAARSHRPERGISCILDAASDTGIKLENKKIWIECKRITSQNKLEKNICDATKQLENILNKQVGSGHRGVVAIDISKIFTKGNQILALKDDESLIRTIDAMMDDFIKKNHEVWESVYERRSNKIIGTLIRFSFMASSENRNLLVHASQWGMNPKITVSSSDENILRKLALNLKDSL